MLWKDLQKQNPDLTSTVDMIITRQPAIIRHSSNNSTVAFFFPCREELKQEQRMRDLTAAVQAQQEEAKALAQVSQFY